MVAKGDRPGRGRPDKGNFIIGCSVGAAFATRAIARYCLGRSGWLNDLRTACPWPARRPHLLRRTRRLQLLAWGSFVGVVSPDDPALRETENALQIAERSGDDLALVWARMTLGVALVHRETAAERERGNKLSTAVSEDLLHRGHNLADLPIIKVYLAHEKIGVEIAMRL